MKKTVFFLVFLLLTGCSSSTGIDETDPDYLCLKNAEFFTIEGLGHGYRDIPEEIYAFGRLFEKENAVDYFYKLEAEATNEGKLYALCGLYFLDYDNYPNLMEKYGSIDDEVLRGGGDTWDTSPISKMIKREDGDDIFAVRLNGIEDTIDAWGERTGNTSYRLDFYGGSIPAFMRETLENPRPPIG